VIHYALNYDKPDLRRPSRFTSRLIPESLRDALVQGMKHNVDERLSNAGQLLVALQSCSDVVEVKKPIKPGALQASSPTLLCRGQGAAGTGKESVIHTANLSRAPLWADVLA